MWRRPAMLMLVVAVAWGTLGTGTHLAQAMEQLAAVQDSSPHILPTVRAGAAASADALDAAELVSLLGDRSFAVRREATSRLVELGIAAMGALEQGVQSEDREISFRSRHVLSIVREHDFQRRLRAFASGQNLADQYHLPGWPLFAKDVGTDREARLLFVEMQRAEPKLLSVLEESPEDLSDELTERSRPCRPLGHWIVKRTASLGTVATVLFVLNSHDVELPRCWYRVSDPIFAIPALSERFVVARNSSCCGRC